MHEIHSHPVAQPADFRSVKCIEGYERIAAEYAVYLADESKTSSRSVESLFFPKTEAELAAVIREMGARHVPVTIAGARTGLAGGCVPSGGALVSLELLDRIDSVFWDRPAGEWRVRAQAGVSLKSLDTLVKSKRFPSLEKNSDPGIQAELARFKEDSSGYFYPPDPTEMSASLGGSVATNASGARTYRYGPTRAWIRGIRVCLASGEYLDIPRGKYFASPAGRFTLFDSAGKSVTFTAPNYSIPKTKCAAGYFAAPEMDLVDLFIGSEGTLGIITQVDVALLKREEKLSMVQFTASDDQAVQLTIALRENPRLSLDFLEFYSHNALDLIRERQAREPSVVGMPPLPPSAGAAVFFEMDFDPHAAPLGFADLKETLLQCGADTANSWTGYEPRELERFKVFRHLIPETVNDIIAERKKSCPGLHKLGTDLAVPNAHLVDMWRLYRDSLDAAGLEWLAFGHIGNNHIHVNILPKDLADQEKGLALYTRFAQKAVEYGGAVSAEHGVGKLKTDFFKLMFSEDQIGQMRAVKTALDPQGLLNPGDIFDR